MNLDFFKQESLGENFENFSINNKLVEYCPPNYAPLKPLDSSHPTTVGRSQEDGAIRRALFGGGNNVGVKRESKKEYLNKSLSKE